MRLPDRLRRGRAAAAAAAAARDLARRSSGLTPVLAVVLAVAAAALHWIQLERNHAGLRANAVAAAEKRAEQLASAMAGQVANLTRTIDFSLKMLRGEYGKDGRRFAFLVNAVLESFPEGSLVHVAVIGADGYVAYSSRGLAAPTYVGDREHFRAHLAGEDRLHVSKPVVGRVTGVWSILFTRPILHDGAFDGVMVVSTSSDYFSARLAQLEVSPDDAIALFDRDGIFLARNRDNALALGHRVRPGRPFLRADAAPAGLFRSESSVDDRRRLFAWQWIEEAGLVTVVGLDEESLYAPLAAAHRSERIRGVAIVALILAAGLGLAAAVRAATRQRRKLSVAEERHRQLFDSMNDAFVVAVDASGRIVEFNRLYEAAMGYSGEELRRLTYTDITPSRWHDMEERILAEEVMTRGYSRFYEKEYRRRDGSLFPVELRTFLLRDEDGRACGMWAIVRDISERRAARERLEAALCEKEVLLKEIYHRVKNNLQVVASLLSLQGRHVRDEATRRLFEESGERVKSMALVHEQLYRSRDLSSVDFRGYLVRLTEQLGLAYRPLSSRVPVVLRVGEVPLRIESAVPLGLVVNELVTNAFKHGYAPDASGGRIEVCVERLADGRLRLAVSDDGRGLPAGFAPTATSSLGMQLVLTLAGQLEAELRHSAPGPGAWFEILFRPPPAASSP